MLDSQTLDRFLAQFPKLSIGLVGDLFLDKYLELDQSLTEISIETGLEAFQVVRTRCYPGAGGTVLNNLQALRVGNLSAISVIGDDGEGYELTRELGIRGVNTAGVIVRTDRMTPTYTKPMLSQPHGEPRELNRIDTKNRTPQSTEVDQLVIEKLREAAPYLDALIVADQVTERNRGVITDAVRDELSRLGATHPNLLIFVDSRSHLGLFRNCTTKPNRTELDVALGRVGNPTDGNSPDLVLDAAREVSRRSGRPIFTTLGPDGILWSDGAHSVHVPGIVVEGPIDIVGAGDSTTAGIVAALCAGATAEQAAAVGCLVASITIQQIGVTGTASPEQVKDRLESAQWNRTIGEIPSS
ncbi:MAG: PfkB family carbohydrate kinase [Planctomycetota bacterium]|nr:PfkB family carbohydrate kinase [Planctomycetota bacterium]